MTLQAHQENESKSDLDGIRGTTQDSAKLFAPLPWRGYLASEIEFEEDLVVEICPTDEQYNDSAKPSSYFADENDSLLPLNYKKVSYRKNYSLIHNIFTCIDSLNKATDEDEFENLMKSYTFFAQINALWFNLKDFTNSKGQLDISENSQVRWEKCEVRLGKYSSQDFEEDINALRLPS